MAETKKKESEITMTIELYESASENKVLVGGIISKKDIRKGSEKKNKDGSLVLNQDGSPQCWEDAHNVTFDFQGGSGVFKLSPDEFNKIDVGSHYQLIGKVVLKTPYGDGKPYLTFDVARFDFLF